MLYPIELLVRESFIPEVIIWRRSVTVNLPSEFFSSQARPLISRLGVLFRGDRLWM